VPIRTVIERGPKGKKVVAFAVDWPGWSRGAKTADLALEALDAYRDRYKPVAVAAGLGSSFSRGGSLRTVEDRIGTGSTDFWGISFSSSSSEHDPMRRAELDRKLVVLQACWGFFDEVAATVSAEMEKGPRGGGRDRDQIVAHTIGTEVGQFAKRLGIRVPPEAVRSPEGLQSHRAAYVDAMRTYNAGEGKRMRTWTLAFLIRHTAFHVMDHAWEMQDKDMLRASDGGGATVSGAPS
jgi:hypothetical protein